jgi:hypothetical protein
MLADETRMSPSGEAATGSEKEMLTTSTLHWIALDALRSNPRNARTHSKKQVRQIADSIQAFRLSGTDRGG